MREQQPSTRRSTTIQAMATDIMTEVSIDKKIEWFVESQKDWNYFALVILGANLDPEQQKILSAIQHNKKTSARSGNARGKDYVAAVACLCFLYLNEPSLVVNTAPTGRQVTSIMMKEIRRLHQNAKIRLGGEVLTSEIKFSDGSEKHMIGFKAQDKNIESWTGFHEANIMVVVTEATGLPDETFTSIDSILTGESKLVIVFNPNRCTGEAARSAKARHYVHFRLNNLYAPNVVAKKQIYPGQCDYPWVVDKIERWCRKIDKAHYKKDPHDFEWEDSYYRPNNDFIIKVMGDFPRESPDSLIPYSWVAAAIDRYEAYKELEFASKAPKYLFKCQSCGYNMLLASKDASAKCEKCNGAMSEQEYKVNIRLGVDVAGQGRDNTVYITRSFSPYINLADDVSVDPSDDHMAVVGTINNKLKDSGGTAYIDTIGEGGGVFSRSRELKAPAIQVKFSYSAKGFLDKTNTKTFANMRAYCYWAIRDALDPQLDGDLMLPNIPELIEDLTEPTWRPRSNGDIIIEEKDKIIERLKRSPDWGDALANTFFPYGDIHITFG